MRALRTCRTYLEIPLTRSQRDGAAALLLLAVLVLLVSLCTPREPGSREVPSGDERSGSVVVALDDDPGRGVYFLPGGTTGRAFLEGAHVPPALWPRDEHAGALVSGTVFRREETEARGRLRPSSLDAPRRLALGLPVDVNRATAEELVLVPGIGEGTAEAIVRFRKERGGLRRLEELTEMRGIKEKRLAKLRPYLAVLPGQGPGKGSRRGP